MQRCPKCGYREGIDWPEVVRIFAFCLLGSAFMLSDVQPRLRLSGEIAIVLFFAVGVWMRIREGRKHRKDGSIEIGTSQ